MNEEQRKQVLNTLFGSRGSSRAASEDTGSGEKETETITYYDGIGEVFSETITIQEDDDHEENGKTSPYLKIKIRKTPSAHMPTRGSRGAAGLDLYARRNQYTSGQAKRYPSTRVLLWPYPKDYLERFIRDQESPQNAV